VYGEVFSAVCQGENNHLSIILCLKQVLMDFALQDNHSTFFSLFFFFFFGCWKKEKGLRLSLARYRGEKKRKKKNKGVNYDYL
jgi:hypothetical protein